MWSPMGLKGGHGGVVGPAYISGGQVVNEHGGLVQVWFSFGSGFAFVLQNWPRSAPGLVQVWLRFGAGLVQVLFRFGSGLTQVWFRSVSGLVQVWFKLVQVRGGMPKMAK